MGAFHIFHNAPCFVVHSLLRHYLKQPTVIKELRVKPWIVKIVSLLISALGDYVLLFFFFQIYLYSSVYFYVVCIFLTLGLRNREPNIYNINTSSELYIFGFWRFKSRYFRWFRTKCRKFLLQKIKILKLESSCCWQADCGRMMSAIWCLSIVHNGRMGMRTLFWVWNLSRERL